MLQVFENASYGKDTWELYSWKWRYLDVTLIKMYLRELSLQAKQLKLDCFMDFT